MMARLTGSAMAIDGFSVSAINILVLLGGSIIIYSALVGIYRVYLSPLAKFPGPRLAALTTLYQSYYDIWLGGQYYKKLDQLHEQYGPIIRINPHEIHVGDISFINELYTGGNKKRDKFKWSGRQVLHSLAAAQPHDLHRRRRAALNPFFSEASIRKLEPAIIHGLEAVLARLESTASGEGIFNASLAYKAVTCDIITEFCFGTSTGYIYKDDYEQSYFEAVDDHLHHAWFMAYLPFTGPLMLATPPAIIGWIWPGLKSLWAMHARWLKQITEIRNSDKYNGNQTIFHGLLNSDLPAPELTDNRLQQEAQMLVLAGQDTTAFTLSRITYEMLSNPSILQKLKDELEAAMPQVDTPITSAALKQLPYLSAIINEAIRLHPGVVTRQTRIAPEESLVYTEPDTNRIWSIPPGTPVCMDARSCNLNPDVFPDPLKFLPERWLGNPRLDRHVLSFSKGTRICLGMNLAYAELAIIMAGIFRRYELYDGSGTQTSPTLALHDCVKERDVDVAADYIVPFPAESSTGIHIRVRPAAII